MGKIVSLFEIMLIDIAILGSGGCNCRQASIVFTSWVLYLLIQEGLKQHGFVSFVKYFL
jgi:hypothetical protein